jgi:hypothetical protein
VVGEAIRWLESHWDQLDDYTKGIIKNAINEALEDAVISRIDRDVWKTFLTKHYIHTVG